MTAASHTRNQSGQSLVLTWRRERGSDSRATNADPRFTGGSQTLLDSLVSASSALSESAQFLSSLCTFLILFPELNISDNVP